MKKSVNNTPTPEKRVTIDEKMEAWINLAYAIEAGEANAADYPKDFQEWYFSNKDGYNA